MGNYKVLRVFYEENTNPYYSSDTCNNGGGYFQPYTRVLIGTDAGKFEVTVDDCSCGDFGTRVFWDVRAESGKLLASACLGTMVGEACVDNAWSDHEFDRLYNLYGFDFGEFVYSIQHKLLDVGGI